MFVFEHSLDTALDHLVGYRNGFVSYFPFIRNQYLYLIKSQRMPNVDIAHFHILDVVIWIALLGWGTYLIVGIIFLKQYDDRFQKLSRVLAEIGLSTIMGVISGSYCTIMFFFLLIIGLWIATDMPTLIRISEFNFMMTHFPRTYFCFISLLYYYSIAFIGMIGLNLTWKVFREKWPGAVLWRG